MWSLKSRKDKSREGNGGVRLWSWLVATCWVTEMFFVLELRSHQRRERVERSSGVESSMLSLSKYVET